MTKGLVVPVPAIASEAAGVVVPMPRKPWVVKVEVAELPKVWRPLQVLAWVRSMSKLSVPEVVMGEPPRLRVPLGVAVVIEVTVPKPRQAEPFSVTQPPVKLTPLAK